MQAEHEELVSNRVALQLYEKAGSPLKEKTLFKGAYHELQKEVHIKEDLIHKVIRFTQKCSRSVGPFGVLDEGKIRYGSLPVRKRAWYQTR